VKHVGTKTARFGRLLRHNPKLLKRVRVTTANRENGTPEVRGGMNVACGAAGGKDAQCS
jgi:hypothetical protein